MRPSLFMLSFVRTLEKRFTGRGASPWLLPFLLAFVLLVRVIHLTPLHNTDAIIKWLFVRRWLATGALPRAEHFSHHNARWAINLPVAVVQSVFGETTLGYYVPILLVGLLQAYFTFRLGVLLGGPLVGTLATLAYTAMPVMGYLGGQLMPECFESAFVLGAFYSMLMAAPAFAPQGARRAWWLAASVGFLILAWLSRETALFYLPGFLLATWCAHRSLKVPALIGAGLALAIAIETAIYRFTYGFPMGRFSIVSQHHLTSHKLRNAVRSIGELFARYADLPAGFNLLFWASVGATTWWLWSNRRNLLGAFQQPLGQMVLLAWGFLAVNTFGLRSLNPPRLIQPPNSRYLVPVAPLLALIVFGVVAPHLQASWERWRPRWRGAAVGAACGIALFASNALANLEHWGPKLVIDYEAKIRRAFDKGVPIFVRSRNGDSMFNARGYLRSDQVLAGVIASVQVGSNRGKALVDKRREPWQGARRTRNGYDARTLRWFAGKTVFEVTGAKLLRFKERTLEPGKKARSLKPKLSKRRKRAVHRARSHPKTK